MATDNFPVSMQHFKRIFKNQQRIIMLVMILVFLIEFFFTVILSTSTIRQFAETYFKLIPPMVRQLTGFMGESFVGSQFIAFGYTHPAILFMLAFIPVSITSRYITAEIENRSIELLALRLLPRFKMVLTPYAFILFSFLGIYISMFFGSFLGRELLGLILDVYLYLILKIIFIGLLFFSTIAAIVLYIACRSNERGTAISWSIGVVLMLFVFDAIIRLWPQIEMLKPYSLFNWYQPVNIATGRYDYSIGIPLLILFSIFFLGAALYRFTKRDL